MNLIDPKELESMRHQLEDAQRWNASLQARLGAIQNRGGGVGGANDGKTRKQTMQMSYSCIYKPLKEFCLKSLFHVVF